MEQSQQQRGNEYLVELERRIVKLETDQSYMQEHVGTCTGLLKELQRHFINLASEHKAIQQLVRGWPFVKVPKE